jgi:hypothetical protein
MNFFDGLPACQMSRAPHSALESDKYDIAGKR